ncbi:MAG TPA: ATP-binding protein [Oligoflexia bacterium]|nr:ATP-binding protein [Oligoflexia bacterium]HMP49420.1 ATP-binding protein [Oligoflexia bacterium]
MPVDLKRAYSYRVIEALSLFSVITEIPVVMVGTPGIGKTSIMNSLGRALKRRVHVVTVPGKNMLADIVGAPRVVQRELARSGRIVDQVEYVPYDYVVDLYDDPEPSILMFDDLHSANPEMQAVIMGLMYDRRFGSYTLSRTSMVATSNPEDGTLGFISTLANRLFVLPARFPMDEYADRKVAHANSDLEHYPDPVLPEVGDWKAFYRLRSLETASFLRNTPGFSNPDPDAGDIELSEQFPSGRTYDYMDKLMGALDASTINGEPLSESYRNDYNLMQKLIAEGTIGTIAAAAYHTFLREKDLPDPEYILKNPARIFSELDLEKRPDRLYFILRIVYRHIQRDLDQSSWTRVWRLISTFTEGGKSSFALAVARLLLTSDNCSRFKSEPVVKHYQDMLKVDQNNTRSRKRGG